MSPADTVAPIIAAVIPCYRVAERIEGVLAGIPSCVSRIYCVDDACPENSGDRIEAGVKDPRVRVLRNPSNLGVGGAVVAGYRRALEEGADIVVKIDGDGQMDPALIPAFIRPIAAGETDYTKGNRFFRVEDVRGMPLARLLGNAGLSFLTKLSSGYWHLFDPTNGYTAIHAAVLRELPLEKLHRGYFFETDMLFRLNTLRAAVQEVPMQARYGDEKSSLKIGRILLPFLAGHIRNLHKRIFYNYFLRDFSIASLELVAGSVLFLFGLIFGLVKWSESAALGVPASAGTVMLSALPFLIGVQMLFSFLQFDIAASPRTPLHPALGLRGP